MILVTIGTSEPFDRLLSALEQLGDDEQIIIQCGRSRVRPALATCVDYLPFDTLAEHIRAARVVVTHAGVGSVMAVLATGKRPIVVPRLRRYGEVVDDHQLAFARRLHRTGVVELVEDLNELPHALATAPEPSAGSAATGNGLATELHRYLHDRIRRAT
jgi:exopolysaccharide biosynthesis glucuronosyltransferase PssE